MAKKPPPYKRIRTKHGWAWIDARGKRVSKERIAQWKADKAFLSDKPKRKQDPSLTVQGKKLSATAHLDRAKVRNAKGKFVKPPKHKKGKLGKLFRTNLGETVPTRFGTKAGKALSKVRDAVLNNGRIPKADATAIAPSDKGNIHVSYWRFEGLQSQKDIARLLALLQTEVEEKGHEISVRYSVGTGFGKGADWTGSHFNRPSETRTYFATWNTNSPSAQEIFRQAEAGGAIWFEVEAQTRKEIVSHGTHGAGRKNQGNGRGSRPPVSSGKTRKGSPAKANAARKHGSKSIQPLRDKQSGMGKNPRRNASKGGKGRGKKKRG